MLGFCPAAEPEMARSGLQCSSLRLFDRQAHDEALGAPYWRELLGEREAERRGACLERVSDEMHRVLARLEGVFFLGDIVILEIFEGDLELDVLGLARLERDGREGLKLALGARLDRSRIRIFDIGLDDLDARARARIADGEAEAERVFALFDRVIGVGEVGIREAEAKGIARLFSAQQAIAVEVGIAHRMADIIENREVRFIDRHAIGEPPRKIRLAKEERGERLSAPRARVKRHHDGVDLITKLLDGERGTAFEDDDDGLCPGEHTRPGDESEIVLPKTEGDAIAALTKDELTLIFAREPDDEDDRVGSCDGRFFTIARIHKEETFA